MIFLKHTMLFAKTCTVSVSLDIYLIEKHKIIEWQVQMRSQYHREYKKVIDILQAFHHDVTVPRICPGSDQIFAKYQGLDPGHDLLVTPR